MARIEWVGLRLDNWARWMVQGDLGMLGYPKQAVFARLAGKGRRGEAVIPLDNIDAALTNQAVESLRWRKPHLYLTLQYIYIRNLGVTQTARKLKRAPSTISSHLEQADAALAQWFSSHADRKKAA